MSLRPDEVMDIEDSLVDPLTGEIYELADTGRIVTNDLPKVCRALRAIHRRKDFIEAYLTEEVNRLTEICNARTKPLTEQMERLSGIAESLLVTSGERRLAYPGLGVVRFVKGRESVNTDGWDAMTPEQQADFAQVKPELVRVVTQLKPDKAVVMDQLRAGQMDIPFSINTPPDKFEFKED